MHQPLRLSCSNRAKGGNLVCVGPVTAPASKAASAPAPGSQVALWNCGSGRRRDRARRFWCPVCLAEEGPALGLCWVCSAPRQRFLAGVLSPWSPALTPHRSPGRPPHAVGIPPGSSLVPRPPGALQWVSPGPLAPRPPGAPCSRSPRPGGSRASAGLWFGPSCCPEAPIQPPRRSLALPACPAPVGSSLSLLCHYESAAEVAVPAALLFWLMVRGKAQALWSRPRGDAPCPRPASRGLGRRPSLVPPAPLPVRPLTGEPRAPLLPPSSQGLREAPPALGTPTCSASVTLMLAFLCCRNLATTDLSFKSDFNLYENNPNLPISRPLLHTNAGHNRCLILLGRFFILKKGCALHEVLFS